MIRIKDYFKEVKDYYFFCPDRLKVYNLNTGRELKTSLMPNGYLRYCLVKDDGRVMTILEHRLTLAILAPVSNWEELQVNHKNGRKNDNFLENLEWCTSKENIAHAWDSKLASTRRGEKSNFNTHSEEEVDFIIDKLVSQEYTDREISDLAKENGWIAKPKYIAKIRRREIWKHKLPEDSVILGKTGKRKL